MRRSRVLRRASNAFSKVVLASASALGPFQNNRERSAHYKRSSIRGAVDFSLRSRAVQAF